MGFYSEVQITAEPKAFEMFSNAIEKFDLNFSKRQTEEYGIIAFDWVKWYPDFDCVKEVEKVMGILDCEHDDETGYGYKFVILNEDDTNEERSNVRGFERFCDFCVSCSIDNPYGAETDKVSADKEHVEDMWCEYLAYLKDWIADHGEINSFGISPKGFDEWKKPFYG